MSNIRIAVDAAVVREGMILLLEYEDTTLGRHFGLPGGGVEPNEQIRDAVRREVHEETGIDVVVGGLLLVNEYVPEAYDSLYGTDHELRLLFRCEPCAGQELEAPTVPDPDQIGIVWLPLEEILTMSFLPRIGVRLFQLLTEHAREDLFNTSL